MPFAYYQQLLRKRLLFLLEELPKETRDDIVRALQEEGKLLREKESQNPPRPNGMWALLPLLVALSVDEKTDVDFVTSVAIAVECFICALDILDDIEDGDTSALLDELGMPRALNLSTLLLGFSSHILSHAGGSSQPERYVLQTLHDALFTATIGQHRDLLNESKEVDEVSTDDCIEIAAQKAGALMALACRLGALSAHAENDLCEEYSKLGRFLGIAHQIDNDCHALYDLLHRSSTAEERGWKTDLERKKKTLPIILAAQAKTMTNDAPVAPDDTMLWMSARLLEKGILGAWGTALLYKEYAREQLQEIEQWRPVVPALRLLLGFT